MNIELISNVTSSNHNSFGNRFSLRLTFDGKGNEGFNLAWWERTDRPYFDEIGWAANEWLNLLEEVGSVSDVFAPWTNRDSTDDEIVLEDPPAINFRDDDSTNKRTLEIFICLSNAEGDARICQIRQELKASRRVIETQSLGLSVSAGTNQPPPEAAFRPI